MGRCIICTAVLAGLLLAGKNAANQSRVERVRIEATKGFAAGSLLHWKISNDSDSGVFVYDVFLWGPAYSFERSTDRVDINTSPIT